MAVGSPGFVGVARATAPNNPPYGAQKLRQASTARKSKSHGQYGGRPAESCWRPPDAERRAGAGRGRRPAAGARGAGPRGAAAATGRGGGARRGAGAARTAPGPASDAATGVVDVTCCTRAHPSAACTGWTSSELLARHGGQLLVLRVRADGVHLEPLEDRITSGGQFAVRRLRSEASPAFVRELVEELAPVAPLRWPQLLEPPRSPTTALPVVTGVLRRALELSRAGLQAAAGSDGNATASAMEALLEATDPAEAIGILNAALVVAIYERIGILSSTNAGIRLSPMSLASARSDDYAHLELEALGHEMRLDVSKV